MPAAGLDEGAGHRRLIYRASDDDHLFARHSHIPPRPEAGRRVCAAGRLRVSPPASFRPA